MTINDQQLQVLKSILPQRTPADVVMEAVMLKKCFNISYKDYCDYIGISTRTLSNYFSKNEGLSVILKGRD